MTLQVLNSSNPPVFLPLKQGYSFSGIDFQDQEMQTNHASISLDHNLSWKINGLNGNKIRVGSEEIASVSLIPGLIFNIGQTGFKVVQRSLPEHYGWEKRAVEFLQSPQWVEIPPKEFFFFLKSVQVVFTQGPQSGETYTLSYGPRFLGFNNLDINIKDPTQAHQIIKFTQAGDSIVIENINDSPDVQINKQPFKQHHINNNDQISFGSNIIEIRF